MAVSLGGAFGYTAYPATNQIDLWVDRIDNPSGATTGALRLELWLTGGDYAGGALNGYRLVADPLNWIDGDGQLSPGEYYSGIRHVVDWPGRPADGFYHVAMVVSEQNGQAANDGYAVSAAGNFNSYFVQRAQGSVAPSNGSDWLAGTHRDDVINSLGGDDVIFTGAGNDRIDGGDGLDTLFLSGVRSGYTISGALHTGNAVVNGPDGVDVLTGVERLHFQDGTLALDTAGHAGQAYRLYQAAFDRVPETQGIGYQTHDMDRGYTLDDLARNFIASPEFQSRYGVPGTVSDTQFITLLYRNVLHREPEAAGMAYHMDGLNHGVAREGLLAHFSESPENQGNVAPAIAQGIWLG